MQASYVKSVYEANDWPHDRKVEIAFAGKSNVGKSSLLNRLVGRRQLAKISGTPGKTRCLNYFLIEPDRGGASFYFVDLPGYGYAKVSKTMRGDWGRLMDRYLAEPDRPAGIIALFDARRDPTAADKDWLEWLALDRRPHLVVLTKSDKLSGNECVKAMRRWTFKNENSEIKPLLSSAVKGTGREKIWGWINTVRRTKRAPTQS